MRISHKNSRYKPVQQKRHRTNTFIKTPQVRLIDENGANIGVIDTDKALDMAQERGLDLVEVSPLADPPVVKIVDYSKLKYQEEKERRKEKAKQKKVEIKVVKLSLRIGEHDTNVRIGQAEKFLGQGDKVKIELIMKGREHQHMPLGREKIQKFIDDVNQLVPINTEQAIAITGGNFSAIIVKKI